MNLTPIKKIVLALAAVTVVVSMVTANNVASMMMIMAARKNTQVVINTGAPVAQNGGSQTVTPGANSGSTATPDTNSGSTATPDSNAGSTATPEAPANPDANKPADNSGSAAPSNDKAKVVAQYTAALAKAKSSAKSVTLVKTGASNYKGVAEAGKLSSFLEKLMGMFMKTTEPNEAVDKSALPPKGRACNVDVSKVKSATCVDKGANYEVTIIVAGEANPTAGNGGVGSIGDIIEMSQITDGVASIPGIELSNISLDYDDTKAVATIDKKTGNMTFLALDVPCILSLDAKIVVKEVKGARVGIENINEYKIAY